MNPCRSKMYAPLVALLLAVGAGPALAGCGGPDQPAKGGAASGLPAWDARARVVFDDDIDPSAVGLSTERGSARADPLFRERVQTADVVARVRVQTVTVDSAGETQTYHLGVQVGIPTLTTARVPDRTFELTIKASSPAFGIARSFDSRLRGQTFVGFVKRYAGDDGEVAIHWHLTADTADTAAAVKEATALGEVTGK